MSIYLRIKLLYFIMSKKNNYNISNESNTPIINELDLLVKELQYKLNNKEVEDKEVTKYRFKLRHFKNALNIIKMYPEKITKGEDLEHIKGIGKGIMSRIDEIIKTKKLSEINRPEIKEIKAELDLINELSEVINIGSKVAKQLIEKNPTSDYIVSIVSDNKEFNNQQKFEKLLNKETVKTIFSYRDLVDEYINDELEYFKFLISSESNKSFYSSLEDLNEFKKLLKKIADIDEPDLSYEANTLLNFLEKEILTDKEFNSLQQKFFLKFDEMTLILKKLGQKNDNLIQNLPFFYKERYLSKNGNYRIEVFPSKDVSKKENLSNFVKDVQSIFPNSTGMPVVQYYAGNVVINSFIFAMIISFIFLTGFIFFIFKKIKFVLMSLFCLLLGSLLTMFLMIILKIDFNFANMISLPLLFSLGVSYPVYFLRRFIELKSVDSVINSKTPSAIFLSAMTTICSFSTLAVSSHQGTSSMGILLFISLLMTIISSMFFLPIILSMFKISFK